MVFDFDDMGVNHIISDQCQAHDCRDALIMLKEANPAFKATLFAIPGEMSFELADWSEANRDWIELGVHGLFHTSNYECEKMGYEEFESHMNHLAPMVLQYFAPGFKAPGWQISDDIYRWLYEHEWWVADQSYNDMRRPIGLKTYVNDNGTFKANGNPVEAWHGHTWNCVGNGIYETLDQLLLMVRDVKEFKFVSEVV